MTLKSAILSLSQFLGLALVVAGVGMVYIPAAVALAGVAVFALSYLMEGSTNADS